MRIALVHAFFDDAGGNERLALEMYRALRELGHEVDLYAAHLDDRAWEVLTSGMRDVPRPEVLGEPLVTRLLRRSGRLLHYRKLLTMGYLARYAEGLRPWPSLLSRSIRRQRRPGSSPWPLPTWQGSLRPP
jgi:hypothetical protein